MRQEKSKNVRGDDRFSGYTPSFATPPSFFDKAISKGKSFVKFASPFLVNAAFGTFVPSKVKKGMVVEKSKINNRFSINLLLTKEILNRKKHYKNKPRSKSVVRNSNEWKLSFLCPTPRKETRKMVQKLEIQW